MHRHHMPEQVIQAFDVVGHVLQTDPQRRSRQAVGLDELLRRALFNTATHMLDAGSDFRLSQVASLNVFGHRLVSRLRAVDLAAELSIYEFLFVLGATISRVGIHIGGAIVGIQQVVQQVAVMPIRGRDFPATDQLVLVVHVDVIFIAEVGLTVLLGPVRIFVALTLLSRGQHAATRAAVMVVIVPLLTNRRFHDGGVDDLTASGEVASFLDLQHQVFEQRFDEFGFNKTFLIHPDGVGVGYGILQLQAEKATKGQPV